MKTFKLALLTLATISVQAFAGDLNVEWAYHDDADGTDDRTSEKVPGQTFAFLGNGSTNISDAAPVTLYVITANQFAGEADEQVFVRWWNGTAENWVAGSWVSNLQIGAGENGLGLFHDQPVEGQVMADLWKIEISPEITQPGVNYYVIQIKGWKDDAATEYYLLRDSAAENTGLNNLNQSWTGTGEYTGHDWSVMIKK